eukprot:gene36385-biopygen3899
MYTELVKRTSPAHVITLGQLSVEQRKQMVDRTLGSAFKAVDERIMAALWESPQCANPMFMTLALNFLISNGSYMYLKSKGVTEILAARDVPYLLQLILSKITDSYTGGAGDRNNVDEIEYVLCAVYCSRVGLMAGELVQYISQEQRKVDGGQRTEHIDSTKWVQLEMLLHLFISPRRGYFNMTHDFVRQAVERKYFGEGRTLAELEKEWLSARDTAGSSTAALADLRSKLENAQGMLKAHHRRLALFFEIRAYSSKLNARLGEEDKSGDVVQRHPTEEARFHQKQAGLRPSVTVAVRVRPPGNARDGVTPSTSSFSCMHVRGRKLYVVQGQVSSAELRDAYVKSRVLALEVYDFDYVLDSSDVSKPKTYASQSQVYKSLGADVVSDIIEGNNATIIAYGQTFSGKSYTMFGTSDDPGLIPRTVRELLSRLTDMQAEGWTWKASCTMVEIYKDKAYDLLDYATAQAGGEKAHKKVVYTECARPTTEIVSGGEDMKTFTFADVAAISGETNPKEGLNLRPATFLKTEAFPTSWRGALVVPVVNVVDIDRLLELGTSVRTTVATGMNDTSSRSHCIFTVYIAMQSSVTGESRSSKMHLVDLAGSERVARAGISHIQESISINTSLSALNACIRALSDPLATFVPFRRSTLTWFLQDSLGGPARTVFLATVSPDPVNRIESQSTLKYATFSKQMAVTKDEARRIADEVKRAGAATGDEVFLELVKKGDVKQVAAALRLKPDLILAKDDNDNVALIWASCYGPASIVELLLNNGADVNCKNKDGETPLNYASMWGHTAIVEMLLDRGASINHRNEDGGEALFHASVYQHTAIEEMLLERGVDMHHDNNVGDDGGESNLFEILL